MGIRQMVYRKVFYWVWEGWESFLDELRFGGRENWVRERVERQDGEEGVQVEGIVSVGFQRGGRVVFFCSYKQINGKMMRCQERGGNDINSQGLGSSRGCVLG